METKETILELLRSTNREGMEGLISYLENSGFFTSPASSKFHGCHPGGLAEHSLKVYVYLQTFYVQFKSKLTEASQSGQIVLPITAENLKISALLHDVCKIGAYIDTGTGHYKWNRAQPVGHAVLSVKRIRDCIQLEELEIMLIRFHMGVYGLFEFEQKSGEYPLRGNQELDKAAKYGQSLANAWYHNPIVKLMYFCDELSTFEGL